MKISENKQILDIEGNKHLTREVKEAIASLLVLAGRDEVNSDTIDAVVASTSGWEYGSVMHDYVEAAEIPDHPDGAAYAERARMVAASLQKGLNLESVYFGDEGFLGFAFRETTEGAERRAFALQLPYVDNPEQPGGRHMLLWKQPSEFTGTWVLKAYVAPRSSPSKFHYGHSWGYVEGPLGSEFARHIDSQEK